MRPRASEPQGGLLHARFDGVSCKNVRVPAAPLKIASAESRALPRANQTPRRAETCAVIRVWRAVIRAEAPALFAADEGAKSDFVSIHSKATKEPRAHANRRAVHTGQTAQHSGARAARIGRPQLFAI